MKINEIKSMKYLREKKLQRKCSQQKVDDTLIVKHGEHDVRVYPKEIFVTKNLKHEQ